MRRRRKKKQLRPLILFLSCLVVGIFLYCNIINITEEDGSKGVFGHTSRVEKPSITESLLTPNEYSRPQTSLKKVNGVVIHYVGNPGTSATANRNYFNGLADSKKTYASSHFIVDLDGTIIQCVPLDEIAYASNSRNEDTISIEVCHPDKSGEFTADSYEALIRLVSWLADKYNLDKEDIIRHYDVTGKKCPLYYVENEDAWNKLKSDIFK